MSKPTKEQVREWQRQQRESHTPPPTPEEIRRQLGWGLIKHEKEIPRDDNKN